MTGQWQGSTRAARLPPNWHTEIRPRILTRDNGQCQIRLPGCTSTATEVDHRQQGDDHNDANLQAACHWCHGKKSSAEGNAARHRYSNKRPAEPHPGLIR